MIETILRDNSVVDREISDWIRTSTQLKPTEKSKFKDIYASYIKETAEQGFAPVGIKTFSRELRRVFQEETQRKALRFENRGGVVIVGLKLLSTKTTNKEEEN